MKLEVEEIHTLVSILKTEIIETKELITNANAFDKKELEKHLEITKSILEKVTK